MPIKKENKGNGLKLRDHQIEAVAAIMRGFEVVQLPSGWTVTSGTHAVPRRGTARAIGEAHAAASGPTGRTPDP
ncbi:hypothetical protein [Streptomyces clavifer]|uniref:hypothetical protein n=1 Tax=Streptomyces clavifer TaxID=68188 RepID=UPI0037FD85AA